MTQPGTHQSLRDLVGFRLDFRASGGEAGELRAGRAVQVHVKECVHVVGGDSQTIEWETAAIKRPETWRLRKECVLPRFHLTKQADAKATDRQANPGRIVGNDGVGQSQTKLVKTRRR
jgi:hypothetical protein